MGNSNFLKAALRYVHTIEFRLFLLSELKFLMNQGKRIRKEILWQICFSPANAEDWINLSRFLDPVEEIFLIDVGANRGEWFTEFLKFFPKTEVVAFEPTSGPFGDMKKTQGHNKNIHLYLYAISNENKSRLISLGKEDTFSYFERYHPDVEQERGAVLSQMTEQVDCRRLDYFDFNISNKSVFLKVDVQGHESEVFEGAGDFLDNVDLCIVEVSFGNEYLKKTHHFPK